MPPLLSMPPLPSLPINASASFPYCQSLRFLPLLSKPPLLSLTVNASAPLPYRQCLRFPPYSLPSFMINASAATPLLAFPLPPLETRHWFVEGLWKHLCQWEKNEQRFRVTKRRNTHHQCICFSQIKREQTQFYQVRVCAKLVLKVLKWKSQLLKFKKWDGQSALTFLLNANIILSDQ